MKFLTKPTLLYLLRRQGKHGEHFRHNLYDHVHHCMGERDLFRINMQATEETTDEFKEIQKRIIARRDAKSGLA